MLNVELSDNEKLEYSVKLFRDILNKCKITNEGIIYTIVRLFANIPFVGNIDVIVDRTKFNLKNCLGKKNLIINFDNGIVTFRVFDNELENNFESFVKICSDDIFDYIYIKSNNSNTKMTFSKEGIELDREVVKTYKEDDVGLLSVVQNIERSSKSEYFTIRNSVKINETISYSDSNIYGISSMPVDERIIFPDIEKRVFGTDDVDSLYKDTLFRYGEEDISKYFPDLINNILHIDNFNTKVKRP